MNLTFTNEAWEEYLYWQSKDKRVLKKINTLIKDIKRDSFSGIGKPELLRHELQGYLSRKVTDEHRLVYEIFEKSVIVISCRYHY